MLIFIAVGIGCLIGGSFYVIQTFDFLSRAVETEAVVVDYWLDHYSENWDEYPVFKFVDLTGAEVYAVGNVNTSYYIGEKVKIFYDPENPSGQVYAGMLHMWAVPLTLLGVGSFFTGIGTYAFIYSE
ncbi:MAG: DUF3592 domain-containing protein [Candidatus Bathyarchaeota archaeon]